MKGFVLGVVVTLAAIAGGVYLIAQNGLYPIGADNPPSALERRLAERAMDVYADKHKPAGDNPVAITPANLLEGAKAYEEHCALCHGGAGDQASHRQFRREGGCRNKARGPCGQHHAGGRRPRPCC